MSSTKIAAAFVTLALLAGCTMRTQAPTSITAYDYSERDAYGQVFAVSPTYGGQDTSWTTSAPARAIGGFWQQEKTAATEGAAAKAKNADEGADPKRGAASADQGGAPVAPPPPRSIPRQTSMPAPVGQSTALPGAGTSGR
ncbi:MAG: hypothetical protein ABJE95_31950 [Byssovorax sp.]